jgi:flavin reductase (DIM6/NTAB) family NADH-FMN oxidoreductase RutF
MNKIEFVSNFNYLLHPYNTFLVTCCDQDGIANIITIAWLIPTSIRPPLLCMSIGPTRYSYGLIQATGEFVVNVASYEIAHQVLFCGRRSGSRVDKFAATGLTPVPARNVRPPIINECLAYIECRLEKDIEAGDHNLVIGKVLDAYARQDVLAEDGLYDLKQASPLFHVGRNRFTTSRAESIEPTLSDSIP